MVFSIYVNELKYRLGYVIWGSICCFAVSYSYATELFYILAEPYYDLWGQGSFLLINVFEVLFGYLKISMATSFIYMLLLLALHGGLFLSSGLYKLEFKRMACNGIAIVINSVGLLWVIYKYLLPLIYTYMIKLSDVSVFGEGLFEIEPRMLNFIELNLRVIFIFYILLYIPMVFLLICRKITNDTVSMLNYRIWVYLLLLVMVVSLLPPDMFLHLIVFGSMVFLLEVMVLLFLLYQSYKERV